MEGSWFVTLIVAILSIVREGMILLLGGGLVELVLT